MKRMTEMTTGIPNPPLRMMAPKGAPIKKNTKQAKESVNFLCHSVMWRRIFAASVPTVEARK